MLQGPEDGPEKATADQMTKGPVYRQREAREPTEAGEKDIYGLSLTAKERAGWKGQLQAGSPAGARLQQADRQRSG